MYVDGLLTTFRQKKIGFNLSWFKSSGLVENILGPWWLEAGSSDFKVNIRNIIKSTFKG